VSKRPSPKIWLKLLQRIKDKLKSDPTVIEVCKKYDVKSNVLDVVPIKFGDINVSATTEKGIITLNWRLLERENRHQIPMYIAHELVHYCQQSFVPTRSADDGDYLSNPFEQEAFQYQIKFIDDHLGEHEADKYVNQVLDHHDKEGKERQKIKKKLKARAQILASYRKV